MMGENISNIRKENTKAAIIIPKQKHANKVNKDVKKVLGKKPLSPMNFQLNLDNVKAKMNDNGIRLGCMQTGRKGK